MSDLFDSPYRLGYSRGGSSGGGEDYDDDDADYDGYVNGYDRGDLVTTATKSGRGRGGGEEDGGAKIRRLRAKGIGLEGRDGYDAIGYDYADDDLYCEVISHWQLVISKEEKRGG